VIARSLREGKADRHLLAGAIGVLRLLSLAGRFILTVYILRFINVEAVGLYGYVVGAYTILTAICGLGMNYTMDRDVVHTPLFIAGLILRDRIIVRTAVAVPIVLVAHFLLPLPDGLRSWLPVIVVLGETLMFDAQRTIAYRGHPLLANAFLYVRSAAWVPFVVFVGAMWPALRTFDVVLAGWAISLAVSVVALAALYRVPALGRGRAMPIDWGWVAESLKVGRLVYIADIGAVLIAFFDRYFIGESLGLDAAGTYVFFWSFTNAIVALVQASHFQVVFPQLVKSRHRGDMALWRTTLLKGMLDVTISASGLSIVIYFIMVATGMGIKAHGGAFGSELFGLMLIGTIVKLLSDLLHDALRSAQRDKACLWIYVLGAVVSPPLTVFLVSTMGLIGAGWQIIVTGLVMLCLRALALRPTFRRERPRAKIPTAPLTTSDAPYVGTVSKSRPSL
jgi:O-antigen/teichoic acid export membrane protein